MNRRTFLSRSSVLGWAALLPPSALAEAARSAATRQEGPKIAELSFERLEGTAVTPDRAWQSQVQPLHLYPNYQPDPYVPVTDPQTRSWTYGAYYLTIRTDDGLEGVYGPVDSEAAVVVDRQLKRFVTGQNPLAGETVWDKMYRSNRHARTGHFMMAISAVDNALWDLRGRYFDAPVYQLLGGPTRDTVPVYGSTLGTSVELDTIQDSAQAFKEQGFQHQKWFIPYGPGNGADGLIHNVEMVRLLREAVGDEVDLMFDAFMGWDLNYAISWAKQVEPYRPRWIEEAFAPNKLASFVELSRRTSIPVASGEHFYNRWEVQDYLDAGALSVVQADPEWCGGVSELVKICTLGSVYDVHVIPHGHNLHAALHVVASQSPMTCPLGEYLIDKMQYYYLFEQNQLTPVEGRITLSDQPGFGIVFDDTKIEDRRAVSWS